MKPYRTNSLIAGLLYFLGTAFGVLSAVVGGEVISSIVKTKPLPDLNLQTMVADHSGYLIGATCLYISFYRTNLIPRWLSIWGLIAVVPYMAYALLHLFQKDHGIGFYLQMLLAPQEMVMALWLIVKGFNKTALDKLIQPHPCN